MYQVNQKMNLNKLQSKLCLFDERIEELEKIITGIDQSGHQVSPITSTLLELNLNLKQEILFEINDLENN